MFLCVILIGTKRRKDFGHKALKHLLKGRFQIVSEVLFLEPIMFSMESAAELKLICTGGQGLTKFLCYWDWKHYLPTKSWTDKNTREVNWVIFSHLQNHADPVSESRGPWSGWNKMAGEAGVVSLLPSSGSTHLAPSDHL